METTRSEYINHWYQYLKDLKENENAQEYMSKVYWYLDSMKPGRVLNLRAEGEKLKWLLIAAGAFFSESDHYMKYEFNDGLTKIRRK